MTTDEYIADHNRRVDAAIAGVRAATLDVIEHPLTVYDRETIRQAVELLARMLAHQRLGDPADRR